MMIMVKEVGPYAIRVIKAIREHTAISLKQAKEITDSKPCVIDINEIAPDFDIKAIKKFFDALKDAGADCEIVGNAFVEDILEDIKVIMHKCVDANEFGIFNELVATFEVALRVSKEK